MKLIYQRLMTRLGHQFADPSLLEQALTHRSFGAENNERLEFLGDAILGFTVAEQLYLRCPGKSEGSLTRMRASLVKKETLAEIARTLELGPALQLGSGELKSGGRERDSILADALEAIIGGVYRDAGINKAQQVIQMWFQARMDRVISVGSQKDAKTTLQEYLQARGLSLPEYQVREARGKPHEQHFKVDCKLESPAISAAGEGASKRAAEKSAAEALLKKLEQISE